MVKVDTGDYANVFPRILLYPIILQMYVVEATHTFL